MSSSLLCYPTHTSGYSSTVPLAQKHLNCHASNRTWHYTASPGIIKKGSSDTSESCIKQKIKHTAVKYSRIVYFQVQLDVKVCHYPLACWYFIPADFKALPIWANQRTTVSGHAGGRLNPTGLTKTSLLASVTDSTLLPTTSGTSLPYSPGFQLAHKYHNYLFQNLRNQQEPYSHQECLESLACVIMLVQRYSAPTVRRLKVSTQPPCRERGHRLSLPPSTPRWQSIRGDYILLGCVF